MGCCSKLNEDVSNSKKEDAKKHPLFYINTFSSFQRQANSLFNWSMVGC
jgi:hypothetical protein